MRRRKPINELTTAENDLLRSAFRALMASDDPDGNYAFWVSVHQSCPHASQLFLPWHRAYILGLENALRLMPGCANVTLPYWDWTVVREIPPLLKVEPMLSERYRNPDPSRLPSVAQIQTVLELDDFLDFGGAGCSCEEEECIGTPGELENYHGDVHKWIGPIMANPATAPQDPIFWFHHSFVDRAWNIWQASHTGDPCSRAPDTVLPGIPGAPTVRSVLDTAALGYEYVDATFRLNGARVTGAPIAIAINLAAAAKVIRLRLDGVHIEEDGVPPDAFDVFVGNAPSRAALISLFGIHGSHDHGPHRHRHERLMGSPAALVPITVTGDLTNVTITLVPRWPEGARSRAAINIRSIHWRAI